MLKSLHALNRACTACPLRLKCQGPVPALIPKTAGIAFVGEAPGKQEDRDGIPFSPRARAGRYLMSLLQSVGLNRDDVIITNVTKCRPEGNATPTTEQAKFCADRWLSLELSLTKPKIIVAMGGTAIRYLLGLGPDSTVEEYQGVPQRTVIGGRETIILPTYHPAAVFRRNSLAGPLQDSFLTLKQLMRGDWTGPIQDDIKTSYGVGLSLDSNLFAVDVETVRDRLWSVQLSDRAGTAVFIPARDWQGVPDGVKIVHNYLYDARFISLPIEETRDTMVMAYLLGLPQGLKTLATLLCGMSMTSYDEYVKPYRKKRTVEYLEMAAVHPLGPPPVLTKEKWVKNKLMVKETHPKHILGKIKRILADTQSKGVDPWDRWHKIEPLERKVVEDVIGSLMDAGLDEINSNQAVEYSCRDADATIRVYGKLWPRINAEGLRFTYEMDMATLPIAMSMMTNGVKVDTGKLRALGLEFFSLMGDKAEEIFKTANVKCPTCEDCLQTGLRRFNPNSDMALRQLLFIDLGLVPTKKTETGLPSVAKEEISKLVHPVIPLIGEYKHIAHLKDSFCDVLPRHVKTDGRVHPTIKTTRTATGRWSMENPNCQQIPIRTELGRRIRQTFVAESGFTLLSMDYSQIEMRVAAHLARCKSMITLFNEGRDIHTETAALIYGVSPQDVTPAQRYPTKTLGFGVMYGLTPHGLYAQMREEGINWSETDCSKFIDEYYRLRPELRDYQEETVAFGIRNGYVSDMFGRQRYVPELLCPDKIVREAGKRAAVNMPIQSGAQGIMKLAMVKMWNTIGRNFGVRWLLQVHDELVWELPPYWVEWWVDKATTVMESVVSLAVPMKVESKTGYSWGDMKKVNR